MEQHKIRQDKKSWIKFTVSLMELRPMLHTLSLITTAIYVIVFFLNQDWAIQFVDTYPKTAYILAAIPSFAAAYYFEKLVSNVIDACGFAIARFKQAKRISIMVSGVTVILVFFAAASSSFGVTTAISSDKGERVDEILSINDKLAAGVTGVKDTKAADEYLEMRKQGRELLLNEKKVKEEQIIARFTPDTTTWRKNTKAAKLATLEATYSKIILDFDAETQKQYEAKLSENNELQKSVLNSNEKVMLEIQSSYQSQDNRLDWLSGLMSYGVIIAVLLSLISAITSHQVCYVLGMEMDELIMQYRQQQLAEKAAKRRLKSKKA